MSLAIGMLLRYTMASPLSSRLVGICLHVLSRRIMPVSHCVTCHRVRMPSSSRDGEQAERGSRPTTRIAAKDERMTAKKDKQARRLARKRKAQRSTPPSGQQVLLNRLRASQHLPNTQVIVNPAGTEKMSEVILRFAEPFKDEDGMVPKALLEIAIIIWNASFMPQEMQRKALEDV